VGDIFREIDEELRQERFDKLWRKYGKHVIALAVAVVIAVAAVSGWRQYQTSRRLDDGARFAAAKALLEDGKSEDARALFAALGRESGTNYGVLARFHEAALRAGAGDVAGAAKDYEALAGDSDLDDTLRDLATILSAFVAVNGASGDVEAISARLGPMAEEGKPWRHSALEVLGLIAHKSGDTGKAKEYYQRIADDADAPRNIRTRAAQMLAIIGN